eukprot:5513260-Amphidinium_carterae.2
MPACWRGVTSASATPRLSRAWQKSCASIMTWFDHSRVTTTHKQHPTPIDEKRGTPFLNLHRSVRLPSASIRRLHSLTRLPLPVRCCSNAFSFVMNK